MSCPIDGEIRGMAVPAGITLIVGGGYHGKSTMLSALQMGVYDHVAGDGREFVLADETAVKLRAEEGRSIRNTDISMFINDLPNGKEHRKLFHAGRAAEALPGGGRVGSALRREAGCF
ncbi:MAG: P-loop domain-containing protein [Clostridium sp.]